jgi:hypothetical protein
MKPFFTEDDCDVNVVGHPGRKRCISMDKANRLLEERGLIVYALRANDFWSAEKPCTSWINIDRAILINIEPIEEPDSKDKILADLMKLDGWPKPYTEVVELAKRARKLLEKSDAQPS